jgi:hypothetical protein
VGPARSRVAAPEEGIVSAGSDSTYAERRALAEALCDFFRCPTTGRVLDGPKHDDKVICGCGKTNPVVAARGHREAPGVHIKTYLRASHLEAEATTAQRCTTRP